MIDLSDNALAALLAEFRSIEASADNEINYGRGTGNAAAEALRAASRLAAACAQLIEALHPEARA